MFSKSLGTLSQKEARVQLFEECLDVVGFSASLEVVHMGENDHEEPHVKVHATVALKPSGIALCHCGSGVVVLISRGVPKTVDISRKPP